MIDYFEILNGRTAWNVRERERQVGEKGISCAFWEGEVCFRQG